MNRAAVTVAEAARELGKDPSTLRKWIANGAPCASPGAAGRGKGALVLVADLQRWRDTARATEPDSRHFLEQLGRILVDYHRAGDHRLVGLQDKAAQLLYAALLEYIEGRLETAQPE